jgi:signal peptidase I
MDPFSNLSQRLADISVTSIAFFAFVLTVIRLVLVRMNNTSARAFAEVVEAALIAVVLVFMIIQPFVMKSFYIPSGSMLPTLMDDDHIVVDKLLFRIHPPHRDDVVVFVAPPQALDQAPENDPDDVGPTNYIKRLIGLPGDVIEARHGFVTVNGRAYDHSDIRLQFNINDRDQQHVKIEANDIDIFDGNRWTAYNAAQVAQEFNAPGAQVTFHPGVTMRNGQLVDEPFIAEDPGYDLKIYNGESVINDPDAGGEKIDGNDPTGPESIAIRDSPAGKVPAGDVFVMGDNRNDSNDSTRWGPLDERALVGKATLIFWPIDRMRMIR